MLQIWRIKDVSAYLSWKISNILQWFQFSNSSELKLKYVSDSLSMKFDINDQVLHFSSQNNNNKTMKRASIFDISWSPSCPPFLLHFLLSKKTFTNFALLLIDIVLKLLHFFSKNLIINSLKHTYYYWLDTPQTIFVKLQKTFFLHSHKNVMFLKEIM